MASAVLSLVALASLLPFSVAQNESSYTPCPLIGAYFPPPTILSSSDTVKGLAAGLTTKFDTLIQNARDPKYGPITPNTTSFSVVLFSGSRETADSPVFFEYHHAASDDGSKENITADTQMPIAELTMIFTIYAWLVEVGDNWEESITTYLPELDGKGTTPWKDITIRALAGHLSGLARESSACTIGGQCYSNDFVEKLSKQSPIFLPDTTPIISHAAFQLLALAIEKHSSKKFADVLDSGVLKPLSMFNTCWLDEQTASGLNLSRAGDPAALSLVSSTNDLAKAGNAILSSRIVPEASTRRWLRPEVDTSNLRNGVGRPWEVFRAGDTAISPILDVLTKSGNLGPFASYFGLSTDFNVGFAILARDQTALEKLDLNVYVDLISDAISDILLLAARETAIRFAGEFKTDDSSATLNITENGPGLEVKSLQIRGVDQKQMIADDLGIKSDDLDFRLYPTNVKDAASHQFVAVFQDKSAPVDAGTPTCITWQTVGAAGVEYRYVFGLSDKGQAKDLSVGDVTLSRGDSKSAGHNRQA